jgi:hypothetical protein
MISSRDIVILRLPAQAGEARNLLFANNFGYLVACRHAV